MSSTLIQERWEKLFWSHVDRSGDCWLWLGHRNEDGYGTVRFQGHMQGAHRVAWILANGAIPEGKQVLHRCDNPPCVRHLFLGTNHDNVLDRHAKGRSKNLFTSSDTHPAKVRCGAKHWRAKLSDEQVRDIRARHASGLTQTAISRDFNVHSATISRIVRGEWRAEVPCQ